MGLKLSVFDVYKYGIPQKLVLASGAILHRIIVLLFDMVQENSGYHESLVRFYQWFNPYVPVWCTCCQFNLHYKLGLAKHFNTVLCSRKAEKATVYRLSPLSWITVFHGDLQIRQASLQKRFFPTH